MIATPPRSPRKGDTIAGLARLQADGYVNPDTGTEIQPEEADDYLLRLRTKEAERVTLSRITEEHEPWWCSNCRIDVLERRCKYCGKTKRDTQRFGYEFLQWEGIFA